MPVLPPRYPKNGLLYAVRDRKEGPTREFLNPLAEAPCTEEAAKHAQVRIRFPARWRTADPRDTYLGEC